MCVNSHKPSLRLSNSSKKNSSKNSTNDSGDLLISIKIKTPTTGTGTFGRWWFNSQSEQQLPIDEFAFPFGASAPSQGFYLSMQA
ncbi:hypothetical protein FRX31_008339 [Thalictrum thalictroides]|uniref:Uncharacterized protein n=1 Tax=Thalictrum thalictroides TaxID=46969 RepID=A0A7J6WX91_THATH|nr:hypothetical protein FRX31_008339 [Thalictrum thalictroides]